MLATARSAALKTISIEPSGHGIGVTKTISPLVVWTEARCGEILREERLLQPRTIKNVLNHKGWAYFAFVVTINEHKIRGDLKKSQDPTIREKLRSASQRRFGDHVQKWNFLGFGGLQVKHGDTRATADLQILPPV